MRANQWTGALPIDVQFWSHVPDRGEGCWEWDGLIQVKGYGTFRHGHRHHLAHRVSWQVHFGPIPNGLLVLHHCDNRKCVNPAHLFVGTPADNSADMVAKGRQARGEQVQPKGPRSPSRRPDVGPYCKRGHLRADATAYQSGQPYCRPCHYDRERARKHAMVAA